MNFKPTWLYIKQHNVTGLKYFGKTTGKCPIQYRGSGIYWLRHLKKYGNDVTTVWYKLFTNKDDLTKFATLFSFENNIVESKTWANLILEDGLSGHPAGIPSNAKGCKVKPRTEEWKRKQSLAQKGRVNPPTSPETSAKLSAGSKGKVWWNNGIKRTKSISCPGVGWVLGKKLTRQV